MMVLIDAHPIKNKVVLARMKRLNRRKMLNRQDTVDDEGEKVGSDRGGREATFTKRSQ
ncbi:hypothetical protein D3C80_1169680 [compost metagenome]